MTTSSPLVAATPSKFRLIAELGRGGMATVFLAIVSGPGGFNKLQVVKQLRMALAADPEFLNMFLDEARLAARINHPNVVQTYEVGFDGKHHFIAMEYLEGLSLESIIRRLDKYESSLEEKAGNETSEPRVAVKSFPLAQRLRVVADTLAGLHYAHELSDFDGTPLNVVHRDVSPHNIIVTYDGHVKLVDFGIAKAADSSADTRTGIIKGKSAYMAPEQFGGSQVDRRADIYAAGVIMWQLMTRKRMWTGLSDADIFRKVATGDLTNPRMIDPSLSEELEAICMKALALRPDDRYQTAADFQSAIEDYLVTCERVTARDVGAWISTQFAEQRAKIKSVIEEQMRGVKDGPLPMLGAQPPSSISATVTDSSPSAQVAQGSVQQRSAGKRIALLMAIGAIAAAALAVGVSLRAKRSASVAGPITAATVVPVASATPSPPLVTLTISAKPENAAIFVDDVRLESNPSTTTMIRDGASHRVRAEAPGFATKRELASFDKSAVSIDIELQPEPEPVVIAPKPRESRRPTGGSVARPVAQPSAPATARETAKAPDPPPPPPSSTATSKPARRGLDPSEPW